ncbi:BTAD domain-containing putative transcriptional regulator [Streptomyces sp. ME19-01-6]|uniref:AfsR/SARP family transcriptional regulator n=1 Tax=Streptomyces sp. ME19-01-6 TaxID=3028686 RepID=UPI0029A19423|nr:BTAD domain-containing putative transcriptional regulator [Streptomyces sp. ME19-01-6]MDX3225300.1 BTAD domain-containing putative transcriptional regulator [Streptomyces sp. ME19-01-6]
MKFYVLGSLRVSSGEGPPKTLAGRKDRAFLAELLAHAGRVVSIDHIVEATSSGHAPVNRVNAVHVRVSRLRSLFRSMADPEAARAVISTEPGAYRLTPGEVDADEFEKLLAASMREREKGFLEGAAVMLDRALSLWEGEAFTDVTAGDCVAAEVDRLTELRLVAFEQQAEVMLAMGAPAQAVSGLKLLVERYPLRETLHGHLMTALHLSGRSAEALAVYAALRSNLAEELGAEPTPELRRLHQTLLARSATDGPPSVWPAPPAAPAAWAYPAQLPHGVVDFVPYEATDVLAHALTAGDRTTSAVTAITGQGGAGKTTAAVHLAHRLRSAFPDGQLYVDLGGSTEHPMDPAAALAQMLLAMDYPASALPEGLGARAACFRDSLKGRRVLTVLDDAADEVQLRHLLPGNVESGVIVTARARLTCIPFTSQVEHNDMSRHQAIRLFRRIVGAERVDREPAAAREVARRCCHLPLALRIAGARLAARPHWSVGDLALRLADEHRVLEELTCDSLSVRSCFVPGYHRLTQDERRLFRILGLSGVRVFSTSGDRALLSLPVPDVVEALERLVDHRLLRVVRKDGHGAPPLFRLPGLAAAYAREQAEAEASDAEWAAARDLRRREGWETRNWGVRDREGRGRGRLAVSLALSCNRLSGC